jgi:hypothetical protein
MRRCYPRTEGADMSEPPRNYMYELAMRWMEANKRHLAELDQLRSLGLEPPPQTCYMAVGANGARPIYEDEAAAIRAAK